MPRVPLKVNGKRYEMEVFIDNLVKIDLDRGAVRTWHAEGCYPGEPLPGQPQFVPVVVMTKQDGLWRVAVFHNTKKTIAEHLGRGNIRK